MQRSSSLLSTVGRRCRRSSPVLAAEATSLIRFRGSKPSPQRTMMKLQNKALSRTFTTKISRASNLRRRNANGSKFSSSSVNAEASSGLKASSPSSASSRASSQSNIPSHVYHQRVGTGPVMGPYGLRRIDYSKEIPPKWPMPASPPPHPNPFRRYLPHFLVLNAACLLAYVYVNREDEQMEKYWTAVEQGNAPVEFGDDDDDYDDYDLDQDEWADDDEDDVVYAAGSDAQAKS